MVMEKITKHKKILSDYKKTKSDHLEKLASKMLDTDEKNSKLKSKIINKDIFKLF
jgi:hypothetical protein